MLAALRVESLAIIESLEIRFEKGLNVLTGETGAGKSILVDALGLLLGGRADPGLVRAGCDEAVVEGLFTGPGLAERAAALGLPAVEDELLIRRTVPRQGRSRVHVNGALATVSLLGELTHGLVDLCGQHEHVTLMRRERHLELLDAHAGLEADRAGFAAAWSQLSEAIREREALAQAALERARRRDWLDFQLQELEEIDPVPGEDEALAAERKTLASTEKLREVARLGQEALLTGEGAAADVATSILYRLEEALALDERLAPSVELLRAAAAELDEAGRLLGQYASSLDGDPWRLEEVDERLERLRRLARKHGGSLELAIARREEMVAERERLGGEEERIATLDDRIARERADLAARARALGAARRKAAEGFASAVQGELRRLGLAGASLQVAFAPAQGIEIEGGAAGPRGAEEAEFLFSANPGEEARPLGRAASGGELSRILLAIKRVLAAADPAGVQVFDEVDTGIGGATALVVGEMLRQIARERQVLCITHLPQVAAFADVHLFVSKEVVGPRTRGRVERLQEPADRERVLARMLAGSEERPAALAAAAELLGAAGGRRARPRRVRRTQQAA